MSSRNKEGMMFEMKRNFDLDEENGKHSDPSDDNASYKHPDMLVLKENNLKNNFNKFSTHILEKHKKTARLNHKGGDADSTEKIKGANRRHSVRIKRVKTKFYEEIPIAKSFRQVLDGFLSAKKRKNTIQITVSMISLLSLIFYIICSYFVNYFIYLNYIDYFVCFIYFIDYMISTCLAHHRLNYLLSSYSILQLFLIIPPLFSTTTKNANTALIIMKIINISRVFRIIPFFKIFSIYKSNENDVKKQIWMIMNTMFMMVFISSGILQILELEEVHKRLSITYNQFERDMLMMRIYFHHYIYFIVVTTSTLGYGDIIPYTIEGKVIVICLVLFTLVLIPKQTNDLIQLMSAKSEYARKKYTASQDIVHVILTGEITIDSLRSFCKEFFHQDHGSQYRHLVIISNKHPSKEMENFLNEKGNDASIFYLEGDPMNEKDLMRADIGKARACILFNNKISQDSYSSDHQNLLLGLYIKKFVCNLNTDINGILDKKSEDQQYSNTNFRLCMQLIKPESKYHYYNSIQNVYRKNMQPDQLILIEEIKMNMLSKSCLTPGILSLLSNLLMSSSSLPHGTDSEWLKEYAEGRGHEIYRIPLGDYYRSYTFLEIVKDIFSRIHAIAFAMEIEIDRNTIIKLNPSTSQTINEIIGSVTSNFMNVNKSNLNCMNVINSSSESEDYLSAKSKSYNVNNIDYSLHEKHDNSPKIKFFIYLICSDKSVAEEVLSKDNEDRKRVNMRLSMGGVNINNSTYTITPNLNDLNRKRIKSTPYFQQDSEEESANSENEGEDFEISPDDYFLNSNSESDLDMKSDLMQNTIKGSDEIVNHVIVCGIHPSLIHFVLPLRAKYLGKENMKHIVILAPNLPQKLYNLFSRFPKITYIQGSPLLPENLFRANIKRADQAVILSLGKKNLKTSYDKSNSNKVFKAPDLEDDQMLDAETIFIYKAIKKANKDIQILTELIATNNVEYLLNKVYINSVLTRKDFFPLYEFTPLFAAGEVFTPAIIDRITCQSFFSPHILIMLEQILNGGIREKNKKIKKLEEDIKIPSSYLWLIRVPPSMINETFEELFIHLIKSHKAVAIALYRKNLSDSSYYVYTNPKKHCLIREYDLTYVFAQYSDITDLLDDRPDETQSKKKKEIIKKSSSSSSSNNSQEDIKRDRATIDLTTTTDINTKIGKHSINIVDSEAIPNRKDEDKEYSNDTFSDEKNKPKIKLTRKNSPNKYQEIDNIKTKLDNVFKRIGELTKSYKKLPEDVENIVNTEINKELNFYVPSFKN